MTAKKRVKKKMSLMSYYLLSSFSVAFVACAVVGLLLFYSSVSALNKMNMTQLSDKLANLAENTSAQQEAMRNISVSLYTKTIYRKSFLAGNSYNDVRLLKDFSQYQTWMQICDSYFLVYNGENKVYNCTPQYDTGSTGSFQYLFRRMLPDDEIEDLHTALNGIHTFTVFQVTEAETSPLVFAFPVYTMGKDNPEGKAILGFIVTNELLRKHASTLIGELTGNVALVAQNGAATVIHGEMPDKAHMLVKESEDGQFTIAYEPPVTADYGLTLQKTFNMLYIVVALLLVAAAAVAIGYTNYMPIRRLSRKYLKGGKPIHANEIDTIESYFDNVLSQKGSLEEDLLKQYELTKRQILELLLSGDTGYASLVKQSFMGIELPGPAYLVIALVAAHTPDEAETERLAKQTQALSEHGMCFYFIRSAMKNRFAVLVNLPEEDNAVNDFAAIALDYINNIFEAASGYSIGVSGAFGDVARLSKAFEQALAKCGVTDNEEADALFWFDEALAGHVVEAISGKTPKDALHFFHEFSKEAMLNGKSYAYEKMAYFRLLSKINAYADREEIIIDPAVIDRIVTASDRQEMKRAFITLLRGFSGEEGFIADAVKEKGSVKIVELMRYINENYTDSGLCLDVLSAEFNISNRYISSIIKAETGFSYKDYLTGIRIAQARRLLKTGMTVTQTCEAVGYGDLANFIKAFKQITGYTPTVFARLKDEQAEGAEE